MIEEGVKLEPLVSLSTNFAEEFKSQVIPSIKSAILNPSELEVTDRQIVRNRITFEYKS